MMREIFQFTPSKDHPEIKGPLSVSVAKNDIDSDAIDIQINDLGSPVNRQYLMNCNAKIPINNSVVQRSRDNWKLAINMDIDHTGRELYGTVYRLNKIPRGETIIGLNWGKGLTKPDDKTSNGYIAKDESDYKSNLRYSDLRSIFMQFIIRNYSDIDLNRHSVLSVTLLLEAIIHLEKFRNGSDRVFVINNDGVVELIGYD